MPTPSARNPAESSKATRGLVGWSRESLAAKMGGYGFRQEAGPTVGKKRISRQGAYSTTNQQEEKEQSDVRHVTGRTGK